MIKINLCPIDELESAYWWVPDVAVVAAVAVAAFFGVEYYLGQIQTEIDDTKAKTAEVLENEHKLAADLQRYAGMEKNQEELEIKLDALKAITVSKISKYKPLIVLEHLAHLRPEGVWYHFINIGKEGDTLEIKGQAFDNLLVAELLSSLKSTTSQDADESDLRTLVYFDSIDLEQTGTPAAAPRGFPELKAFPEWQIRGSFAERGKAIDEKKKKNGGVQADDAELMTGAEPRAPLFRM